ncbi:MAG: hypothetical protein Q9191_006044 [Dirinaria sp. TL-2023a]
MVDDPMRPRKRRRSIADVVREENDAEDSKEDSSSEEEETDDELSDGDDTCDDSGCNSGSEDFGGSSIATDLVSTSMPVPKYATCVRCKQEFDITKNEKRRCRWHDGCLEADDESFADWNEDVHGTIDTPETIRQYPENFIYQCCNEDAMSEGCQLTRHVDKLGS